MLSLVLAIKLFVVPLSSTSMLLRLPVACKRNGSKESKKSRAGIGWRVRDRIREQLRYWMIELYYLLKYDD